MTSNNIAEQYVNEIIDEVVKKNLFDNKNDNSTIKINELKKKIETLKDLVSDLLKKSVNPEPKMEKLEIVVKDKTPEIVIIVPYRDREPQRSAFMKIMPHILEDLNCKVLFVHQRDKRPFNRGAMKNLGFIYVQKMYPDEYKDIILVFHDIDNIPWYKGQFSYRTQRNVINHFYGYPHALGGIFAIKAWDFEHINGFPNIWTWGLEDNMLMRRVEQYKKRKSETERLVLVQGELNKSEFFCLFLEGCCLNCFPPCQSGSPDDGAAVHIACDILATVCVILATGIPVSLPLLERRVGR